MVCYTSQNGSNNGTESEAPDKGYKIGKNVFRTKGEARDHYRSILQRYDVGQVLEKGHAAQVYDLLTCHPRAEQKIGPGVVAITVVRAKAGTRCFAVYREDGSVVDFSYYKAVDGKAQTVRTRILKALRDSVAGDITRAKDRWWNQNQENGAVECELTGELITWSQAHVDHAPPMTFEVVALTFMASQRLSLDDDSILTRRNEFGFGESIASARIAEDFRQYHNRVVSLRVISRRANLEQGPRHRLRKPKRPVEIGGDAE